MHLRFSICVLSIALLLACGAPIDPQALLESGIAKHKAKDYSGAIAEFTKAIDADPKNAEAFWRRARSKAMSGDPRGGFEDADKAYNLAPDQPKYFEVLAKLHGQLNSLDQLIAQLNREVAKNPQNADSVCKRATARLYRGDVKGALSDYEAAIKINPSHVPALYSRANIWSAMKNTDRAIEEFTRVIQLEPKHALAYVSRGMARFDKTEFEAGVADANKALEIDPEMPQAFNLRAIIKWEGLGDSEGALVDHTASITLEPQDPLPYMNRGRIYHAMARRPEAMNDLNKAIELSPKLGHAYFLRGCHHFDTNQWQKALSDFKKAIELTPEEQDHAQLRSWVVRVNLGDRSAADRELGTFLRSRTSGKLKEWFPIIAGYLLGRVNADELFTSWAASTPKAELSQKANAYLYLGYRTLLIDGDKQNAREHFTRGYEVPYKDSIDRVSAYYALEQLTRPR